MTRPELFDYMRTHKIATIIANFSGGNDEGGIDDVEVFTASDKQIANPEGFGEVEEFLDELLYDQYGSFGGDYQAHGTITIELKYESIQLGADESSWTYTSREL